MEQEEKKLKSKKSTEVAVRRLDQEMEAINRAALGLNPDAL